MAALQRFGVRTNIKQRTPEWFADRAQLGAVSASQIMSACGVMEYVQFRDYMLMKRKLIEDKPFAANHHTIRGTICESAIGVWLASILECQIGEGGYWRASWDLRLRVSPDGEIAPGTLIRYPLGKNVTDKPRCAGRHVLESELTLVELKCPFYLKADKKGTYMIKPEYYLQVQMQMWITGASKCVFACVGELLPDDRIGLTNKIGGVVWLVHSDPRVIEWMERRLALFWDLLAIPLPQGEDGIVPKAIMDAFVAECDAFEIHIHTVSSAKRAKLWPEPRPRTIEFLGVFPDVDLRVDDNLPETERVYVESLINTTLRNDLEVGIEVHASAKHWAPQTIAELEDEDGFWASVPDPTMETASVNRVE